MRRNMSWQVLFLQDLCLKKLRIHLKTLSRLTRISQAAFHCESVRTVKHFEISHLMDSLTRQDNLRSLRGLWARFFTCTYINNSAFKSHGRRTATWFCLPKMVCRDDKASPSKQKPSADQLYRKVGFSSFLKSRTGWWTDFDQNGKMEFRYRIWRCLSAISN